MNWQQLQALLWLRWRLSWNSLGRGGVLQTVVVTLLAGFLLLGALGASGGGFALGWLALAKANPEVMLLAWDGLVLLSLFLWLIGLVTEIQRSESIDLAKLLHLPVTLQQVFGLNYLASLLSPSLILMLPASLGLCAGLTLALGAWQLLLVPLSLSWFFLLTAWSYCLRGWLSALMVNKRRRRAVIVWLTMAMVLLVQVPNILFNSHLFNLSSSSRRSKAHAAAPAQPLVSQGLKQLHLLLPPGWVGLGASGLRGGRPGPALAASAAAGLLGLLGLMRAYRSTLRFYQGAEPLGKASAAAALLPAKAPGLLLVERHLPWVAEDTAALALATLRSLLRAPELKMALVMPFVMMAALSAMWVRRLQQAPPEWLSPLVVSSVVLACGFACVPAMANMFGLDRDGFRALVLLPTRRHQILLAKNLAVFPLMGLVGVLFLVALKALLHLPWSALGVGLLQLPMAYLIFCLSCNLLSIWLPYRMAPGTLQAKKPKAIVFVAALLMMLQLPLIAVPVLLPAGLLALFSVQNWLPWLPINFLATLLLLGLVAGLYRLLLPWQGRLLQGREQAILLRVTEEVE